jgi:hypothetical protein
METAVLPAMAPVEDPSGMRPILLTTMNTAVAPVPSGCSAGLTLDPISGQCMRNPWDVIEGSPAGAPVAPPPLPSPPILPSPPFLGPGPEAVPMVLPGFHWKITLANWQLAGLAALVFFGGLGIYFVARK